MDTKTLHVEDTTALPDHPDRVHEMIVDGRRTAFTFKPGEKKPMPIDLALRFNQSGFIVSDPDTGDVYEPAPAQPAGAAALVLKANEVVARLDELTAEALLIRAKVMPGGEALNRSSGKERLMAFVAEYNARQIPKGDGKEGNDDTDREGMAGGGTTPMPQKALNKLFADVE